MIQGDLSLFTFKILKAILSLRQLQKPRTQCQKSILGSAKPHRKKNRRDKVAQCYFLGELQPDSLVFRKLPYSRDVYFAEVNA